MKIEVKNLSGGYSTKQTFSNVSFRVNEGEVLCLLGPNGSGKTTLLKALMNFLPVTDGEIKAGEENIRTLDAENLAKIVSYIPQSHTPTFDYSVSDIVLMGRTCHIAAFSSPTENDIDITVKAMEKLGISHMQNEKYTQLSGGERRLVLIARALCQQAKIILMDEPTSDLDFANQQLVMNTIKALGMEGYSIIISTHAPECPFSVADKVLLLRNGEVIGFGEPDTILCDEMLEKTYGVPMQKVSVTDKNGNLRYLCLPV